MEQDQVEAIASPRCSPSPAPAWADAAFTVDTEHPADGEAPAGERLMRLLLARAG